MLGLFYVLVGLFFLFELALLGLTVVLGGDRVPFRRWGASPASPTKTKTSS